MYRAYRFALDPNKRQRSALASHCGAARFVFNWGLGLVKERLEARARGMTVEVPWSLPELRREWNLVKAEVAPWWPENSKEAYSSGLDGLARALNNFNASKQGKRRGRRVGFPGFRKRGRRDSSRFTTGALRVDDERHVVLPRLGRLKTSEATTALGEEIAHGRARILAATISREAERWFVSFTVESERKPATGNGHQDTVGVDVGVCSLATLSTGELILGAKALKQGLRKLRRLSRAHSRKPKGSAKRRKAARRLARCHARVANLRRDHLHKLSTTLAKSHGRVALEDLNVSGMLGNRRLARAIADAGWGELRRMLEYKCRWYGSELVVVDRWYPSSKVCSECGAVKAELSLRERRFTCESCGVVVDRDLNAARNLARWAETYVLANVAASAAETGNGPGADGRPGLARAGREEGATEQPGGPAPVSEPTGVTGGLQQDVPYVPC